MDSGWARWILEQYQFPFEKVFPPTLDAGNLNAKYDVLVFVEGGIPAIGAGAGGAQPAAADIPAEYRPMLGRMTAERTIPELRRFVENGGTVITIGAASTNLAQHFKLPIADHLVENGKPLPEAKFYRAGIGADGQGRQRASARARDEGAHRHLLRQQPRLQARGRRGRARASSRSPGSTPPRRSRAAGRGARATCRTASP